MPLHVFISFAPSFLAEEKGLRGGCFVLGNFVPGKRSKEKVPGTHVIMAL